MKRLSYGVAGLPFLGALPFLAACNLGSLPLETGGGGTGGEGLTGIVVDRSGAPVAGARVRVDAAPSDALAKPGHADSAVTDAEGRYAFSCLYRTPYNVQVSAVVGNATLGLFLPEVSPPETPDLGADTLRLPGSLVVEVLDAQGAPKAGASCRIVGSGWQTVSDSVGTCLFASLPPGTFRVAVAQGKKKVVSGWTEVHSGVSGSAGEVRMEDPPKGIPADWIHLSALGFDFFMPPDLEPVREGQAEGVWQAEYRNADPEGLELKIVSGVMLLDFAREYSETILWAEAGLRAVLMTGRIPETYSSMRGNFVAVRVESLSGSPPAEELPTFLAIYQKAGDQSRARRMIRTVRRWPGPGPIPLSKPAPPMLRAPLQGAVVTTDSVLTWINPNSLLVSRYRVQVFADTSAGAVQEDTLTLEGKADLNWYSSAPLTYAVPGRTYHWRVVAEGRSGSAVSDWGSFVVDTAWKAFRIEEYVFKGPPDLWYEGEYSGTESYFHTYRKEGLRLFFEMGLVYGPPMDYTGMPGYGVEEVSWNDSTKGVLEWYETDSGHMVVLKILTLGAEQQWTWSTTLARVQAGTPALQEEGKGILRSVRHGLP